MVTIQFVGIKKENLRMIIIGLKHKSFIFKIDENQLDNSILSRVKNPKLAIYHYEQNINVFTYDYIRFHEITISFNDLALHISVNNEPYCYYEHYSSYYENNLNLRNYYKEVHLLEECEIYKIVKKNYLFY